MLAIIKLQDSRYVAAFENVRYSQVFVEELLVHEASVFRRSTKCRYNADFQISSLFVHLALLGRCSDRGVQHLSGLVSHREGMEKAQRVSPEDVDCSRQQRVPRASAVFGRCPAVDDGERPLAPPSGQYYCSLGWVLTHSTSGQKLGRYQSP